MYVTLSRTMLVIVCLIKINCYYYYRIIFHDNPEVEVMIIPYFINKEIKAQRS